MLKERRRKRPPRSLDPAAFVTARVRRLVEDAHGGNLLEASAHAGVPYGTLREMHAGRNRHPEVDTLEQLARAYGLPRDWFTSSTARDDGTIPAAGWIGFLPPDPNASGPDNPRRVTIPFAAWPLIRVLGQLEERLRAIPAGPNRPIIGAATDPRECRRRLTAFIFQPVLAARMAGISVFGGANASVAGDVKGKHAEQWIDMLRDLGRFWEHALGDLLGEARTGAPASGPSWC